ncbi:MAG: hypothetical protein F6K30_30475 [Cyanothece sp. SIO2G6]|nr:hypothetical protein [Cyanothece sp. SIO2G6]
MTKLLWLGRSPHILNHSNDLNQSSRDSIRLSIENTGIWSKLPDTLGADSERSLPF